MVAVSRLQPALLVDPMAEAETVILELCRVLLGAGPKGPDRGLMSHIVQGRQHIERCQIGMRLTPGLGGGPCSARCLAAHAALDAAERWLREHGVERMR